MVVVFSVRNSAIPFGQRQWTIIGLRLLVREFAPITALDGLLRHIAIEIEQAKHTADEGDRAEQLAILGGALGIYSDEAVEAALKSALIQTKIDALAASYVAGNISVEEMRTGLQNFIAELDGVSGEAGETGGAIEELSEKMASLPTSHEFVIKITQDGEIPTIPNGPQGKGGDPTKMSGGGLVTGGVPGKDSVWKLLMPGERVLNTAQTQEWNRGSKGDSGAKSINIPINVTVQGGGDPDAIANAIQAKFMATARARGL